MIVYVRRSRNNAQSKEVVDSITAFINEFNDKNNRDLIDKSNMYIKTFGNKKGR